MPEITLNLFQAYCAEMNAAICLEAKPERTIM
jgi:hypothetical protein